MENEYGCKVCRVLDERGLERYNERMIDQWQGDKQTRKGYRELARWLNVTLLRREMDRAGLSTLGDEAESKYDRLVAGDSNAAEIEHILEREGIDVDGLQGDFVSYGVVRTHIKECLGAEYEKSQSSEWEREAIDIATDHARSKIEDAVSSLRSKGELDAGGEIDVTVTAELECSNCHSKVPLQRAVRREYLCECSAGETVEG